MTHSTMSKEATQHTAVSRENPFEWLGLQIQSALCKLSERVDKNLYSLELEIRYRKNLKGEDLKGRPWYALLQHFVDSFGTLNIEEEEVEIYEYPGCNTVVRKSPAGDQGLYKTPLDRIVFPEFRCALSLERKNEEVHGSKYLQQKLTVLKTVHIKKRFVFEKAFCEIHMTTYTENGAQSYAVEVEINLEKIAGQDSHDKEGLLQKILDELRKVHSEILNFQTDSKALPKIYIDPDLSRTNLKWNVWEFGKSKLHIYDQRPIDLTGKIFFSQSWIDRAIVTPKTDGLKSVLIAHESGIYDGSVKLGTCTAHRPGSVVLHAERTGGTYLVFDAETSGPYEARMQFVRSILKDFTIVRGVAVKCKEYSKYSSLAELNEFINRLNRNTEDGFILYHPETEFSHDALKAKVYKWKFSHTIDLLVKDKKLFYRSGKDLEELREKVVVSTQRFKSDIPNQIVEYSVVKGNETKLVFSKFRPDKKIPNAKLTVLSVLRSTQLREDLFSKKQNSPVFFRRACNLFKSKIIQSQSKLKVLDVGSGNGGDLLKWNSSQLREIHCIEPNNENHSEFIDRLEKFQNLVPEIHVHNESWEEASKKSFPSDFDACNLFFMLNDVPITSLMNLFKFLKERCLGPKGKVNCLFLDYKRIRENRTASYYTIVLKENGRSSFSLLDSQSFKTEHQEYQVTSDIVIENLRKIGGKFKISLLDNFLMTNEEFELYKHYRYLEWTPNSP